MKPLDHAYIIDDDKVYVYATKMMMEMAAFTNKVTVHENGLDAIEALRPLMVQNEIDQLPDVILVDLNMPLMDGWQFIEAFVQIPCEKTIPLYIVTSSIDPEDRKRAERYSQVSGYLPKPLWRSMLTSILEEISKGNKPAATNPLYHDGQ